MISNRKLWLSVGAFATLASGCSREHNDVSEPSAAPTSTQSDASHGGGMANMTDPDPFRGNFSGALSKLLAGEGGEGGIGTYLTEGRMIIPALQGPQIEQALTGNTLRRDNAFAVHFELGGKFSGWERAAQIVDTSLCKDSSQYVLGDDGVCRLFKDTTISDGQWSARDGKLCTMPALARAAKSEGCVFLHLVLNEVAIVTPAGAMVGKGNTLAKGKQLER